LNAITVETTRKKENVAMGLQSTSIRVMLAGAALAATMLAAPAQELKQVNIMVNNNNTTNLFPVIVARNLGWFEKEGIAVNYLNADTTVAYVAFLSNGQADAVMLDAPQTFQAVAQKLPIKVVYEAQQFASEGLFVPESGGVKTVEDLKGKTIGLASDRDRVTAQIVLEHAGLSIDDVETVVVGDSGPVVAKAVKDGAVQAFAAASSDLALQAANGNVMKDLTPRELKINPANTFSVWEPRLAELRPSLEKYFKVWAMATHAAKLAPDIVAKMCAKQVPEEWESAAAGQILMDASIFQATPMGEKYGEVQPAVWTSIQPAYIKAGELNAEIDPATFLDGSLIAAANQFDEARIKADLGAWNAANP
jgi:NitT/TauT family transport system substrate-binding protein